MQGYDAQAASNEQQIVIAELSINSPDFGLLEPTLTAALDELQALGITDAPGVLLADAGYWHQDQMNAVIARGIQVLIPPDAGNRKGKATRPGWNGGIYAFMRRILQTDHGAELYRKRKGMIEPIFGHLKFNQRIDRFQRRGRSACRSEWRLICATHNLTKLHRHHLAPATADRAATGSRLRQLAEAPPAVVADPTTDRRPLRNSHVEKLHSAAVTGTARA